MSTAYRNEEYNAEIKVDKKYVVTDVTCANGEINLKVGDSIQAVYQQPNYIRTKSGKVVEANGEPIKFTTKATTKAAEEKAAERGGFDEIWQMNVWMSS